MLKTSGGKLSHDKGIVAAIAIAVLGAVNVSSLFTELDDYMYDSTVDENHVHLLIKDIAKYASTTWAKKAQQSCLIKTSGES